MTSAALVHTLDMETCSVQDTQFSAKFTLTPEKDCELTAIAGYFDTFFDMKEKPIWFTTGSFVCLSVCLSVYLIFLIKKFGP